MKVYVIAWHRFNGEQKEKEGINASSAPLSTPIPAPLSSKSNGHVIYSLLNPSDDLKLLTSVSGLSASPFPSTPKAPSKQTTTEI